MNTKLFVENLTPSVTYNELMELFSIHGNVSEMNLPMDRAGGRTRGFGFVTMAAEGAGAAIAALDGKEIGTHNLRVICAPLEKRELASLSRRNPRRSFRSLY
nr:RNA-binding protein [uncultured bacterium]